MSHHWTHLRVSPSHLKRRMWTAFWVPWVSAVVTRAKVSPTRPPWARSPRSMKWGSRCTSSWTTLLVWPLPSQPRATTTTITTTLTIHITPATVALTWMELPAHLGLWTTPVELYSAVPPLGRKCTSVASPNQWVSFFSPTDVCMFAIHLIFCIDFGHIGWYVTYKFRKFTGDCAWLCRGSGLPSCLIWVWVPRHHSSLQEAEPHLELHWDGERNTHSYSYLDLELYYIILIALFVHATKSSIKFI